MTRLPEFRLAYEPDALPVEAFDAYGATARTLRSFIGSYQELLRKVTDSLIPDPDVRR
jgi:transaldolase